MAPILGTFFYLLLVRSLFLALLVGGCLLLISWTRQPEHRMLRRLEPALPLRGRWLRYLLAAFLAPTLAYAAWMLLVALTGASLTGYISGG